MGAAGDVWYPLAGVLGPLVVAVLMVLILRQFMLWYWRVNQIVSRLDRIIKELRLISTKMQATNISQESEVPAEEPCAPSS